MKGKRGMGDIGKGIDTSVGMVYGTYSIDISEYWCGCISVIQMITVMWCRDIGTVLVFIVSYW